MHSVLFVSCFLCLMALKTYSQKLSIILAIFSCFGICKSTSLYRGIIRLHLCIIVPPALTWIYPPKVGVWFFFCPQKRVTSHTGFFFSQEELPPVNKQLKTELHAPAAGILLCKETTWKTKEGKNPVSPLCFTCTLEAKWTRQSRTGDVLLMQYSRLTVL